MLNLVVFLFSCLAVIFSTQTSDPASLAICMLVPLIYFGLFFLNTKSPLKDSFVVMLLFLIFLSADAFLINLSAFHYGLVALPPWQWPPVWAASLMLVLSVFVFKLPNLKKPMTILGALLGSATMTAVYFVFLERAELLFLHRPKNGFLMIFFATWVLVLLFSLSLKRKAGRPPS